MTSAEATKPHVAFGFLGTTLDKGKGDKRWKRWRPTISLCTQPTLGIDRLELFVPDFAQDLADVVSADLRIVAPHTEVRRHPMTFEDPWDFEEVYDKLLEFARAYPFDADREEYLVHLTTGTHVAQICTFLLTETRFFPAKLVQTAPGGDETGSAAVIDLDLSRYDRLASRFAELKRDAVSFLKQGIQTKNAGFNTMIDEIEKVAIASKDPILLTGPTGAGKTQLARRIFALKKERNQVKGELVEVNCATLRGDQAMSTLFGHKKGAFTGATTDRAGLLAAADGGMLFLDEVGELGLDEQAMLLKALESGTYLPMGSDTERTSRFQLIAGTNRSLSDEVGEGRFREDLLARIELWTYRLPSLAERREDIAPNLEYELEQYARRNGTPASFSAEAKRAFLSFAEAPTTSWRGNFRDLNAAVTRMGTLAAGARIDEANVGREIERLESGWKGRDEGAGAARDDAAILDEVLGAEGAADLDLFDRVQLAEVIRVCRRSKTLSAAGRALFAASRAKKKSSNDADRLRKYLARFELSFEAVQ